MALKLVGLFALLVLLGSTVGLKWRALAFALAGPVVLLLRGAVVYAFMFVFLDNVLFVLYPYPFIGDWLAEHVF